ncbi:hypothetical protein R3P38DRAFT_2771799 [Favolaschia claudopus]|uniref:Uncharacterized protein n=1 Tax=Favolaschia claudopus TaxID=2862362 RepID=A0AAW0CBI0_9AGAR
MGGRRLLNVDEISSASGAGSRRRPPESQVIMGCSLESRGAVFEAVDREGGETTVVGVESAVRAGRSSSWHGKGRRRRRAVLVWKRAESERIKESAVAACSKVVLLRYLFRPRERRCGGSTLRWRKADLTVWVKNEGDSRRTDRGTKGGCGKGIARGFEERRCRAGGARSLKTATTGRRDSRSAKGARGTLGDNRRQQMLGLWSWLETMQAGFLHGQKPAVEYLSQLDSPSLNAKGGQAYCISLYGGNRQATVTKRLPYFKATDPP